MLKKNSSIVLLLFILFLFSCDKKELPGTNEIVQLVSATIGGTSILKEDEFVPPLQTITLNFSVGINQETEDAIILLDAQELEKSRIIQFLDNNKTLLITLDELLNEGQNYTLEIDPSLEGLNGEKFAGIEIEISVTKEELKILSLFEVSDEPNEILPPNVRNEIPRNPIFEFELTHSVPLDVLKDEIILIGDQNYSFNVTESSTTKYKLEPEAELGGLRKVNLLFPADIGEAVDRPFETISYRLQTQVDSTYNFPQISDEELLTKIQQETFKYFWDFGHPESGLARERNTSGNTVTSGGSGFGLMSMIVAVEREFITRSEAIDQWKKIFDFLENAERFHGAWSHWLDGNTGNARPFSPMDNGGDLVETAFLVQGMLTVRQYLDENNPAEKEIIDQINLLWESVEWSWYQRGGQNVLYWHWSPEFGWAMNLPIRGHNETQIIYILAASSPTFGIDKVVYDQGYARNGDILNGNFYYDILLPLGFSKGGPLFFSHYSYLGLDPRNLEDQYANYWEQNVNHTLINREHCIRNPQNYILYSKDCWGLTASDGNQGYSAHSPNNDRGVITPTAAISSLPYTPEESMEAIRFFYYVLGDRIWGEYGFYDAFNATEDWYTDSYIAIDQGPIICMIENYRTGLLWDLFMSAPEIKQGLDKLGFSY